MPSPLVPTSSRHTDATMQATGRNGSTNGIPPVAGQSNAGSAHAMATSVAVETYSRSSPTRHVHNDDDAAHRHDHVAHRMAKRRRRESPVPPPDESLSSSAGPSLDALPSVGSTILQQHQILNVGTAAMVPANSLQTVPDAVKSTPSGHQADHPSAESLAQTAAEAQSLQTQPSVTAVQPLFFTANSQGLPAPMLQQAQIQQPYSPVANARLVMINATPGMGQQIVVGNNGAVFMSAPNPYPLTDLNMPFPTGLPGPAARPGAQQTIPVMDAQPRVPSRTPAGLPIAPIPATTAQRAPLTVAPHIQFAQSLYQQPHLQTLQPMQPLQYAPQWPGFAYPQPTPPALVPILLAQPPQNSQPPGLISPPLRPPARMPISAAARLSIPNESMQQQPSTASDVRRERTEDQVLASSSLRNSSQPLTRKPTPRKPTKKRTERPCNRGNSLSSVPSVLKTPEPSQPGIYNHSDYKLQLELTKRHLAITGSSLPGASGGKIAIPTVDTQIRDLPRILCILGDYKRLAPNQVLTRLQIEVFIAGEHEPNVRSRGRNRPILRGQVGMRCRHCKHLSTISRHRGATYFPASIRGMYQAAQNMSTSHMQTGICQQMPEDIKQEFARLSMTKRTASGAGRTYWAETAAQIGLVDVDDGIRFIHHLTQTERSKLTKEGPPQLSIYNLS